MLADGALKFGRTEAHAVFVFFCFVYFIFVLYVVVPVLLYAHLAVGACMQQVVLRLADCSLLYCCFSSLLQVVLRLAD